MAQAENTGQFQMDPKDLEDLKQDLLATIFNETHNQLLLLQQGQRGKSTINNKGRTLSKNYNTVNAKESMPSEEVLNDIKFDQEIDALRKICKLAFEALTADKNNEENPYLDILKAIEEQNHISNKADILTNELEANKSVLKHLKAEQIKQENEIAAKLAQKKQRVQELRNRMRDMQCINRLELKLVEKWEANRLSQATIAGEKEERLLMQQILNVNRAIADEQRLINEIEKFRNKEISELKEQIQEWQEKFKSEQTTKTTENLTLSQNIADVIKTHEKYREIMEQRKIFVAEYLQQKAEEQRLYEEQCYRIKCAIRIQAWWRGVMVRRGLGPYRKKSKKVKKSKGKK